LSVEVIQTRKNTLNMLKALKTLPSNYKLVLSGGNGYGSEAIHEFIRTESLSDRAIILGYIDDAATGSPLPGSERVFFFPPSKRASAFPCWKPWQTALPVVTSNVSSMPEVGGEAALYVDPHNAADIAQKVIQAVEDVALRDVLIQKGLARASEFTWRRTAEATLAVYDEVLKL